MGVTKALTKVAIEGGQQFLQRMGKAKTLPKLSGMTTDTIVKHVDANKGVDIPDIEAMFKGMVNGDDASYAAFGEFESTKMAANQYQKNLGDLERTVNYKYKPFQVDESLPIEEQKRIYKKAASDFIYEAEQAEGKTVPVSRFFEEKGKLRTPDEGELDLKWKKKIDGKKDFQPKLKKTTAKETALRKSREKPWITKKSEIEDILKKLGQEDKLDQLIKLIRSQYNKKVKQIKASGLSKGHQKSLEKGGWDVPENIIGEQGVSTKEVRGNYARQYKEDLPDEELMKQGAFIGTLEEYILMKLKELE